MNSLILQLTGVNLGYTIIALQFYYCIIFWYSLFMGFMSWTEDGNYHIKKTIKALFIAVAVTCLVVAINWYPPPEIVEECGLVKLCTFDTVIAILISLLQDLSTFFVIAVALVYLFRSWLRTMSRSQPDKVPQLTKPQNGEAK